MICCKIIKEGILPMERVHFIQHKNRQILYIDYSNLAKPAEVLPVIATLFDLVKTLKSKQLFLSNATNGSADKDTMAALKEVAKYCNDNKLVEKECIVGVTGIKKVLLTAVNAFARSNIVMFNTMDEAKDWLVTE